MAELQIFNNPTFGEIRTTKINEQPYISLTDLCKILDIKNVVEILVSHVFYFVSFSDNNF